MAKSVYTTQLLSTPIRHRPSVSSVLDSAFSLVTESVSSVSWSPLVFIAEKTIVGLLSRIVHGHVYVNTPAGRTYSFPQNPQEDISPSELILDASQLKATLQIRHESFWTRVLLGSDLGFAEAYMNGDVDCDDVGALLRIFIVNRDYISVATTASKLFSLPGFVTQSRFAGSLGNTQANISAHYDIGDVLFTSFLSPDMTYSCPIYAHLGTTDTLEDAQRRKIRYLINKAQIRPGHRVLEIGTGWGTLALMLLQIYPTCTVNTLTLSIHQKAFAEKQIAAAGLSDQITVHLMDYRTIRDLPEWHRSFDRAISVEMVEAVGKQYLSYFWSTVDWALKKKDAVGVIQSTTLPEARVRSYDQNIDFIQKWIFPKCYIPSVSLLIQTLQNGAEGRFIPDTIVNIGPDNYPRGLATWRENFIKNFKPVIAQALRLHYGLNDRALEMFRRKWMYYFSYCEEGFAARIINVHIITFVREGNPGLRPTL